MNAPKTYVLLLLTATTIVGGIIAWRQYGELAELRSAAMNKDERANLQKRVWDLEKLNRQLRDQFGAQGAGDAEGLTPSAPEGERVARGRLGRGERGGDPRGRGASIEQQALAVRELMNKPEVQAMLNFQQRAGIDARYSALFKNLNLAPEQVEKLKTLLAERSTTMQDVLSAARDQGINPRENPEGYRKLVADAQNDANAAIKSVIGEQGFAHLTTYEQTLPQRNLVNELQQRLSYSSTPLTSAQAEQMVQILAATSPQRPANPVDPTVASLTQGGPPMGGRGGGGGFGPPGGDLGGMIGALGGGAGLSMLVGGLDGGGRGPASSVTVTPAAVNEAQAVLAPPQVAALQQIQQQQQTQQQLRQMVSETLTASRPAAPGPADASGKGTAVVPAVPSTRVPKR